MPYISVLLSIAYSYSSINTQLCLNNISNYITIYLPQESDEASEMLSKQTASSATSTERFDKDLVSSKFSLSYLSVSFNM